MLMRGVVGGAIFLYLLILGCVVVPQDRSADAASGEVHAALTDAGGNNFLHAGRSDPLSQHLPFRGVALQVQRVDWIDRYEKNIDQIAAVGADTILLVVDARQENGRSNHIYLDMRATPTPQQLGRLIQHAHEKSLRVVLMPIVLLDNPRATEWRGTLAPQNWDQWWNSYRDMIGHFAWVAQANQVEVLVVGSELVSTEEQIDQWTRTIAKVRQSYHGLITYSSNWDHYTAVPFWDQLDLFGLNSYYKMGADHTVTVGQIEARWQEIQRDLVSFSRKINKPILFLEVGWCSLQNAAHQPWDYTQTQLPVDLDLQKRLYEGFFASWFGNADLGGFMMWVWTPGASGPMDKGYSPQGKPAEQVLRQWLNKPWPVPQRAVVEEKSVSPG